VKRFSIIPRVVKKASEVQRLASGSAGVLDRQTHETGIIFSANAVRWLGSDSVEADGGYYCGGRCACACTFAVHLEAGKWIAKLLRVNAISHGPSWFLNSSQVLSRNVAIWSVRLRLMNLVLSLLEKVRACLKLLAIRKDHLFKTHSWRTVPVAIADNRYLVARFERILAPTVIR